MGMVLTALKMSLEKIHLQHMSLVTAFQLLHRLLSTEEIVLIKTADSVKPGQIKQQQQQQNAIPA